MLPHDGIGSYFRPSFGFYSWTYKNFVEYTLLFCFAASVFIHRLGHVQFSLMSLCGYLCVGILFFISSDSRNDSVDNYLIIISSELLQEYKWLYTLYMNDENMLCKKVFVTEFGHSLITLIMKDTSVQ